MHAIVQPAMSQSTYFAPDAFGKSPGLLSIGSPALTQPIQFFEGTTTVGTGALSANGTLASVTINTAAPGRHVYTAAYPGDSIYGPFPFGSVVVNVEKALSTTALSVAATAEYGTPLIFSALVSGQAGIPTGMADFFDSTTSLGSSMLANGVINLTIPLNGGTHTAKAVYSGNTNYQGSSSPSILIVVRPAQSLTSVSTSVQAVSANGNVILSAVVAGIAGYSYPTGFVTFTDGQLTLGSVAVNAGRAILQTSFQTVGSRSVLAKYSGDANYLGSQGNLVETVLPAVSSISLSLSTLSVYLGGPVTLSSTVSPITAGTISFHDGAITVGSAPADPVTGTATVSYTPSGLGPHQLTAVAEPSAGVSGAVSGMQMLTVVNAIVITAVPGTIVVTPGTQGTVTLRLESQGGFVGVTSLSCTSPVSYITCKTPASTSLSSNGSVDVKATISVATKTSALEQESSALRALLAAALPGFILLLGRRRRFPRVALMCSICFVAALTSVAGCGSGVRAVTADGSSPAGTQVLKFTTGASTSTNVNVSFQ